MYSYRVSFYNPGGWCRFGCIEVDTIEQGKALAEQWLGTPPVLAPDVDGLYILLRPDAVDDEYPSAVQLSPIGDVEAGREALRKEFGR